MLSSIAFISAGSSKVVNFLRSIQKALFASSLYASVFIESMKSYVGCPFQLTGFRNSLAYELSTTNFELHTSALPCAGEDFFTAVPNWFKYNYRVLLLNTLAQKPIHRFVF